METCRTIASVRAVVRQARRAGRSIGLVPTMGALHAAHLSLVDAARRDAHFTVVSIFVNPTQFVPGEDFERYPRPEQRDLAACDAAGVNAVFLPPVEAMYPPDAATGVRVTGLTDHLCGPHRPGHFDGVTTIVAKLFNIVQPDAAYFGEKDYQQLQVIRRMTADLDWPIQIIGCPLVREPDGLAMSSRNAYLSAAERQQALCLITALRRAREMILAGEDDPRRLEDAMRRVIAAAGPAEIDYITAVDPETLQPAARAVPPVTLALAVRIGVTRLIDNLTIDRAAESA